MVFPRRLLTSGPAACLAAEGELCCGMRGRISSGARKKNGSWETGLREPGV